MLVGSFTVDGKDDKDLKRRIELVKLFAERAADQTVVVQPMFPGKAMARDSVAVRIVVPKCGDSALKVTNGTLRAVGTSGKIKLSCKNGSVRVERPAGSVDANTSLGPQPTDRSPSRSPTATTFPSMSRPATAWPASRSARATTAS